MLLSDSLILLYQAFVTSFVITSTKAMRAEARRRARITAGLVIMSGH
jgi:hypothetical protein